MQARGYPPQRLTATATDTYRPCHRCSDADGEYKTVTVYRVSDPPAPWWVTREIHCCAGGHSEIIACRTSAVLCAAGPAPAEPDTGPVVRAFTETIEEPVVEDAALANNQEDFGVVFDKVFAEKIVKHFNTQTDLGVRYFNPDQEFRKDLDRQARTAAYRLIRRRHGLPEL
jgi:hypothetical protein